MMISVDNGDGSANGGKGNERLCTTVIVVGETEVRDSC